MLLGSNGSGKTSLLEAIYLLLRGKSFRGVDRDIVRGSEDWYRVDLGVDENMRVLRYQQSPAAKKSFEIDGKKSLRLKAADKLPVVLFEPDDLRMITGSPSRRRHFLDMFISQYDPLYASALSRYERALLQRNKLLKSPTLARDALFVWDVALSEHGAYIAAKRSDVIARINRELTDTYRQISGTDDTVTVVYSHAAQNSPSYYLQRLATEYGRDRMLGSTSVGPHRHDMVAGFNGRLAADVCSRGEIRTIHLALKFIEARLMQEFCGKQPVILLDDVFGELDASRQKRLVSEFSQHQIVITSAVKLGYVPKKSTVITL